MNISIVIPTYRRPELLHRCVTALMNQDFSYGPCEIIVVSDGPDEQTKQLIENLETHQATVRFLCLETKKGPAAARNYGWRNAQAKFIAFTDDDCIPDRQWLSSLWEALQKNHNDHIAFSGRTIVPLPETPTDYERNIAHLEQAEFITANCACTKEALKKAGGFDETFTMAWREDSDLQFRLMMLDIPIIKVETVCVIHPVRKAPWGVSLKEERKGYFNALLYKKFPSLYRQRIRSSPPLLYYMVSGAAVGFLLGLLMGSWNLSLIAFIIWFIVTLWFTAKRLKHTSRSWDHIMEMGATSALIPFLSIYWHWYGIFKFRVRLLPR